MSTFQKLQSNSFLVNTDTITSTLWSGFVPTLTTFFTSSTQEASTSGNYYLNVYQTASTDSNAAVQMAVAYGNKDGSGSSFFNSAVTGSSYTRTIYGQYRTLVLGDENSDFSFGAVTHTDFYAIGIERARYKEKLFLGAMNLLLSGSGGTKLYLTDNSKDVTTVTYNDSGRVFQIVSGSSGAAYSGTGYTTNSGSYGFFLPDVGLILLNAKALDLNAANGGISIGTTRSFDGDTGYNNNRLYDAIKRGASFKLNSEETVTSNYVMVHVPSDQLNYSENPSFISSSTGEIIYKSEGFNFNPVVYPTTVGLYNNSGELVAVAKLSKPLKKTFTDQLSLRIKLDF